MKRWIAWLLCLLLCCCALPVSAAAVCHAPARRILHKKILQNPSVCVIV